MISLSLVTMGSYLKYLGTDLVLLFVAGFIYIKLTPIDEIKLISQGNKAAAIALAGAMIGYGLVLYSTTTHAYGILDTAVWSLISLGVQVGAMELSRLLLRAFHDDWKQQIEAGDVAHGIYAGAFSLTFGIINAACVT